MAVQIDLSGKTALITGGSRGIGRETALRLAEAGANVAFSWFQSAEGAEEVAARIGSDRCLAVKADVGDPAAVERLVDATVSRFGRLDIVVNNAAVFETNRFDRPDYDGWIADWRHTFEVNVFGAANVSYLALRQMRKQGGGKIVHVASRAAFRGETECAAYGASKAALVNLTRSMARALAAEGIITTCVAPGWVETDMAAADLARDRASIEGQTAYGRVATTEEIASAILFLASPLADYLAGVTIDVNGASWFQ